MSKYEICPICGKQFKSKNCGNGRHKKYCSVECFRISIKKPEKKHGIFICESCGKEYSLPRTGKDKYIPENLCSYQCRVNMFYKKDPSKKKTYVCMWCGKEFVEWTYRNRVFCSHQCMSEYAAIQPKPNLRKPQNYVTLNCEWCGKEYTIHKIFINRTHKNGTKTTSRFCSMECISQYRSEIMKGENNPQYIDGNSINNLDRGENWLSQRRKALKRDFHTCKICGTGYNSDGIIIDVHHIIPYRLFNGDYKEANKLSNLITLCRKCHAKVEHGSLNCPKP
jgi:hypothetical protein